MQNRPGTKRHGAFDGIFQFPDIAWPIMGHQPPHGVLRNCADWALWIAEFFQERINQQRDITFALTQWRQLDLDDVEAEKEILAEGAGANGGFQIAVGGSDRPHIDPHAISRAHRPDFALLKRAQQLGLHIHREIANFVEENSSAVTGFQQAGVSVLRPREGSFYVAKQFGFDEGRDQGRTVHGNEWLALSYAQKMDRPRDEFFTGPAFSKY